jgi:hypothetical protein
LCASTVCLRSTRSIGECVVRMDYGRGLPCSFLLVRCLVGMTDFDSHIRGLFSGIYWCALRRLEVIFG